MKIDLHTHTTWSSGFCEPAELVRWASMADIRTLAITDHHAVGGYLQAAPHAERLGVSLIPAIELDCRAWGRRVDLLGYWIDPYNLELQQFLQHWRGGVHALLHDEAVLSALFALKQCPFDLDDFREQADQQFPSYPRLLEILVANGWAATIGDAYRQMQHFSRQGLLPRVQRRDPSIEEGAGVLRAAGGVVVLAHPEIVHDDDVVRRIAGSGLVDALESPYGGYWADREERNAHYALMAAEFNLPTSGGSDYHAYPFSDVPLGVEVDEAEFERLKAIKRHVN